MKARMFIWLLILVPFLFHPGQISAQENKTALKKVIIIHIQDTGFSPQAITINQGDAVLFENDGKQDHWPASDPHPTHDLYPEFDPQKAIKPGENWSFFFD